MFAGVRLLEVLYLSFDLLLSPIVFPLILDLEGEVSGMTPCCSPPLSFLARLVLFPLLDVLKN